MMRLETAGRTYPPLDCDLLQHFMLTGLDSVAVCVCVLLWQNVILNRAPAAGTTPKGFEGFASILRVYK